MNRLWLFWAGLLICSVASAQSYRAIRLLKKGEFTEAISLAESKKSLEKNPIKYHRFLARANALIGNDIRAEKEYLKALEYVDGKTNKLVLSDFDILDELALLYVRTGNWQKAQDLIDRSRESRVRKWRKNDPTNYRPFLPQGLLYHAQGQNDSAKYYLKTFAKNLRNSNYTNFLDVDQYADVYQILAEISLEENDYSSALNYAKKSKRLQKHFWTKRQVGKNYPDRIRALNTLTSVHLRQNNLRKAKKRNALVLKYMEKHLIGQDLIRAKVLLNQAEIAHRSKNEKQAGVLLQEVMASQLHYVETTFVYLSEYEKENSYHEFHATNDRITSLAAAILAETDDSNDLAGSLLNFVINTKALILSESNKLITHTEDDSLRQQLDEWKELKSQWVFLTTSKRKANLEVRDEVQERIVRLEKNIVSNLELAPRADWTQISAHLNPDEMALEFVQVSGAENENTLLCFLIDSSGEAPVWQSLELPVSADKLANFYVNAIKYQVADSVSYDAIWGQLPIPDHIKKVYVSPSGALHQINFNTLHDSNNEPLVDRYEIINLSNTKTLINKNHQSQTLTKAVLIGKTEFGTEIPELPGVEKELTDIERLLARNQVNTEVYLDESNLISTFRDLSDFEILHIASHGYWSDSNRLPMLGSGLILETPNQETDGRFSAYEASLLHLDQTDLVVLSACGSGLGAINTGEGVYGLQRAFEVAGVSNIIMSLWEIDDAFTSFFMTTFYENLLESKNVAQAFQETLKEARRKNPDPRLWGAFKMLAFYQ